MFSRLSHVQGPVENHAQIPKRIFVMKGGTANIKNRNIFTSGVANKMFLQTIQQIVFLILNRVPAAFVTDPKLIRPSIPVMTHSLDQKVMTRKAKARKCTAENVGNIQANPGR
jgi:hypothetical protein